jgi:hypothetical protein
VLYGGQQEEGTPYNTKNKYTMNIFLKKNSKIYGPSYVNGVWRIKYDDELYKLFKEQNIVQSIKINRLKWLGYIRRMDESCLCKKLTFYQLEGRRKKGRPKLRQLDDVLQDLKILKTTAW